MPIVVDSDANLVYFATLEFDIIHKTYLPCVCESVIDKPEPTRFITAKKSLTAEKRLTDF